MHAFDVGSDNKPSNRKLFADFMVDGIKCGPDGARCDVDGNLWVSSNGNPGGRGLGCALRVFGTNIDQSGVAPRRLIAERNS